MGHDGARIKALVEAGFKQPTAWKSTLTGYACNSNDSGHSPEIPEDLVERTEQHLAGKAVCVSCGQDITYAPTVNTREAPVFQNQEMQRNHEDIQRTLRVLHDKAFIEETEAKLLGMAPPLPLITAPDPKFVRQFWLTHGHAPTKDELARMPRRKR